jgi:hypothetical protein
LRKGHFQAQPVLLAVVGTVVAKHWAEAMIMKNLFTLIFALALLSVTAIPSLAQGRERRVYLGTQQHSSRVYYDQRYHDRSFWDKHRDKLTVAGGTAGGALLGAVIGGQKGAIIGAAAGAGGSALYTYAIRDRHHRRYWR